ELGYDRHSGRSLLIARFRAHPRRHERDCSQMRQTMTAELRLEGKINKSRHREAANRSFRLSRGPIRFTLVASGAHDGESSRLQFGSFASVAFLRVSLY